MHGGITGVTATGAVAGQSVVGYKKQGAGQCDICFLLY